MKVLFLGPQNRGYESIFSAHGDEVVVYEEALTLPVLESMKPDFLVSCGYRHILKPEVLDKFKDRAVNLHISYLPWNRGADPNLWSFIEDTPKGVTIHHLDCGIDTGDIIAQRKVEMSGSETLSSSYDKLQKTMLDLFKAVWPEIRAGKAKRTKQTGQGSFHKTSDRARVEALLAQGWNTPVALLRNKCNA